ASKSASPGQLREFCRERIQNQKAQRDHETPTGRSRGRSDETHPASVAIMSGNNSCAIQRVQVSHHETASHPPPRTAASPLFHISQPADRERSSSVWKSRRLTLLSLLLSLSSSG